MEYQRGVGAQAGERGMCRRIEERGKGGEGVRPGVGGRVAELAELLVGSGVEGAMMLGQQAVFSPHHHVRRARLEGEEECVEHHRPPHKGERSVDKKLVGLAGSYISVGKVDFWSSFCGNLSAKKS